MNKLAVSISEIHTPTGWGIWNRLDEQGNEWKLKMLCPTEQDAKYTVERWKRSRWEYETYSTDAGYLPPDLYRIEYGKLEPSENSGYYLMWWRGYRHWTDYPKCQHSWIWPDGKHPYNWCEWRLVGCFETPEDLEKDLKICNRVDEDEYRRDPGCKVERVVIRELWTPL